MKLNDSNVFTEKKRPVFGIDLGTTNSCISIVKQGNVPEIITLENGKNTMPSCVMYMPDGSTIVGQEAYEQRHKTNVVYSVKKKMGSREKIVVRGKEGGVTFTKTVTPVEVSAEILKALVDKINYCYKDVQDVVITVPADFNTVEVDDTIKAAKLAGLNVLQILREPTSAALALGVDSKVDGDILVYDLGGGTFDVSLINITKNAGDAEDLDDLYGFGETVSDKSASYVVKSTRGDVNLGGDDLDRELLKILLSKAKAMKLPVHRLNKIDKERLLLTMEKIKKHGVDTEYSVPVEVNYTENGKKLSKSAEVVISPDDFIKATIVIFEKTRRFIEDVLRGYNGKIQAIVTVGGSTSNPIIHQLLKENFNIPVYNGLNPDESVSLGAAIQAKNLAYGDGDIAIMDVLSNGIGILSDNRIQNIIPRDSTVPCTFSRTFGTVVDNQQQVTVEIYSGNSSLKQECDYVGQLVIDDIPEGPAGDVGVGVILSIDSNGVLSCQVVTANGTKKAEIKNVLSSGENKTKLEVREKKVIRWRELASTLDEDDATAFNELIDEFEENGTRETEIVSMVRKLKDKIVSAPLSQTVRSGLSRMKEIGYDGSKVGDSGE